MSGQCQQQQVEQQVGEVEHLATVGMTRPRSSSCGQQRENGKRRPFERHRSVPGWQPRRQQRPLRGCQELWGPPREEGRGAGEGVEEGWGLASLQEGRVSWVWVHQEAAGGQVLGLT